MNNNERILTLGGDFFVVVLLSVRAQDYRTVARMRARVRAGTFSAATTVHIARAVLTGAKRSQVKNI